MGRFKEMKGSAIERGKEKGDAGIARGEQRVRELQSVKGMIDSLDVQDDSDRSQAEALKASYLERGRQAYRSEVDSVVKSAKGDLEANKRDISAERGKVEDAARKVGDMRGVTDIARGEAGKAEGGLKQSAAEYKNMEAKTENIEREQEQKSQNILNRIESIFG
jgi:hypothetical protein